MISSNTKKWLTEAPLPAKWRKRLEVTLGVVGTAGAIVALSAVVHPSPERVAELQGKQPLMSTWAPPPPPDYGTPHQVYMTHEMSRAIELGDVPGMNRNFQKGMPLHGMLGVAAKSGKKEAVQWLLDHGAEVHEDYYSGNSPLLAADDHPEIVSLLLEHGAVEPSLEIAAGAIAPNAVERILKKHPDPNENNAAAIEALAASTAGTPANKRAIMKRLLDAGANPNRKSGEGALAGAIDSCDSDHDAAIAADCMTIIQMLLDRNTDLTGEAFGAALALTDASKRSVLVDKFLDAPVATKGFNSVALARATRIDAADLKRVIKKGVDWSWHDGEDDAALPVVAAVRRGDRDTVRTFLEAGAPVDVQFKDGTSAMSEALDHSGNGGDSARIIELLVSKGASVNRRLADGRTPLFAASEQGDLRIVNFLISKGARVNDMILDDTALDVAESNGHTPVARVIHAHGGRRGRPQTPMYGYNQGL